MWARTYESPSVSPKERALESVAFARARSVGFVVLSFAACTTNRIDLFPDGTGPRPPDSVESGTVADATIMDAIAETSKGSDILQPLDATSIADAANTDEIIEEANEAGVADVPSPPLGEGGVGAGGCQSDRDCHDTSAPRCESKRQVCVQCIGDSDCHDSTESKCNLFTNACTSACAPNGACPSPEVCDTNQGVCTDCVVDTDCAPLHQPRCSNQECVACLTNQDCASPTRCWQNTCVMCVTNADCSDASLCSKSHECN
jgi:hypothetical protein